jgi:hypothetical protein
MTVKSYQYVRTEYDDNYFSRLIPLVHITTKSDRTYKVPQYKVDKYGNRHYLYIVHADNPPYHKVMRCITTENNIIVKEHEFLTNQFYRSYRKFNRRCDDFVSSFSNLLEEKKILCVRLDLTLPKHNTKTNIVSFMDIIKKKLRRDNIELCGYIWKYEIGEEKYLFHYHVMLAISRPDNPSNVIFNANTLKEIWGFRAYSRYIYRDLADEINYMRKNNKLFITSKTKRNVYKLYSSSSKFTPPKVKQSTVDSSQVNIEQISTRVTERETPYRLTLAFPAHLVTNWIPKASSAIGKVSKLIKTRIINFGRAIWQSSA